MRSPFTADVLEAIAKVLADTHEGLTGSDIAHILQECRVRDTDPTMTKWKRLYNAFVHAQNAAQHGGMVVGFIHKAMKPARWRGLSVDFGDMRMNLNEALYLTGLELGEDGCLREVEASRTLTEAERRADQLRAKLTARGVHSDVLRFCRAELVERNYFHAVLEASKSVADKIRNLSGLTNDGADLVQDALGLRRGPILAINSLQTDTEKGEQRGLVNLLVGVFGTFRNPTAHEARVYWPIDEADALDILSLLSLVHRPASHRRRHLHRPDESRPDRCRSWQRGARPFLPVVGF